MLKIFLYFCISFARKKRNWFHKTLHNSWMVGRRKLPDPSLNRICNVLSIDVQYTLSFQWTNVGLKWLLTWYLQHVNPLLQIHLLFLGFAIPWRKLCQKTISFLANVTCRRIRFPYWHGRCKVIAPKGELANKGISGAGYGNITVLAAINAFDKAIEVLVIFTCKNFQSSW